MIKKTKCEFNNQWDGPIPSLTSNAEVKKKDSTNNQWTSTLKTCPGNYNENCHP